MKTQKINLLKTMAEKDDLQAVIVYSPLWRKENFRYLTGVNFFGPCSMVLYLRDKNEVSLVFSSEWDKQKAESSLKNVKSFITLEDGWKGLSEILTSENLKCIGFSGYEFLPIGLNDSFEKAGIEVKKADGYLEKVRLIKTPEEIESLRAAVNLADRAFPTFLDGIARGLNEFQIVAEVEYKLKKMGAEDNFMLISTGGKEVFGMTPPQARVAKEGNLVLTELTPQLNGWWCQICRSVVKGQPSQDQLKAFSIFYEAVEAGMAAVKPGVNIRDVAKAENDVFRKYGYGEYTTSQYTRVRGHGHGMHLDEAPTVNEDVDLIIEKGMVIVIHPNTYSPLCGYMVFGDPVVVTENGCEILSTTERKLFQV
jgi:Xaa-Pro aminopeptidase